MAESGVEDLAVQRSNDSKPVPKPALEALIALRADLGRHAELKAVGDVRHRAWKCDIEERIEQAFSTLPESAGPLNSQGLVAKALVALDTRAPEYLKHLASYLDTLLWLEEQS